MCKCFLEVRSKRSYWCRRRKYLLLAMFVFKHSTHKNRWKKLSSYDGCTLVSKFRLKYFSIVFRFRLPELQRSPMAWRSGSEGVNPLEPVGTLLPIGFTSKCITGCKCFFFCTATCVSVQVRTAELNWGVHVPFGVPVKIKVRKAKIHLFWGFVCQHLKKKIIH